MKERRKKIEFSPRILLIVFTVICIIMIAVSAMFKKAARPLSFITGTFIVPMQDGINSVGVWLDDYFDSFESMKELQKKNETLTERVNDLTQANEELRASQSE
ncbi:MAG: rod shape-determining protein MreC, partial [Eubacterium sp.]|nr:rod shape-determining protein MreC [Eubacterium sp.]